MNKCCVLFLYLFLFLSFSCDSFTKAEPPQALARVENSFLFLKDIKLDQFRDLSTADSVFLMNSLITNWATAKLLDQGARLNLSKTKQEEFGLLVQQYKADLYTNAYLDALVQKNIDTIITAEELEKAYRNNKEVFKLNEGLVKLRYIKTTKNISNFEEVKKRFKRFDSLDQFVLDSISLQFNSFFLNDSTWIKADQALLKINPQNNANYTDVLKKPNFVQLEDSLEVYLVHINAIRNRNEQAPLDYVRPTLKQIVLNKRKLKLISKLKNDIVNDAIKNKKFEIY